MKLLGIGSEFDGGVVIAIGTYGILLRKHEATVCLSQREVERMLRHESKSVAA